MARYWIPLTNQNVLNTVLAHAKLWFCPFKDLQILTGVCRKIVETFVCDFYKKVQRQT